MDLFGFIREYFIEGVDIGKTATFPDFVADAVSYLPDPIIINYSYIVSYLYPSLKRLMEICMITFCQMDSK